MKSTLKTSLYYLLFCMMITLLCADTISVQGVLRDPLGKTVSDGTYAMTFRLYDQATGGTALWEETQGSVQVLHGVYNAELGSVTPLDALPFDTTYWLGLSIEGGVELEPRFKLLKSPAAMSVLGSENVFPSVGPVGVGTFSPDAALHIIADSADTKLHIEQSNGEDIIVVDPAGNFGVRVSTPAEALDINGNLKMRNGGAIMFSDGSSLSSAFFGGSASSLTSNGNTVITTDADNNGSGEVQFKVGNTTEILVANNGNVGIGNGLNAPVVKLDVNGDISGSIFLDKDDNNYYLDPSDANISAIFAGKVGIGIGSNTPNAQLQVNGSLVANSLWIGTTSGYPLEVLSDQLRTGWFLNSSPNSAGAAIYANSTNYAGYFEGDLHYTGSLTGPSDRKFKTDVQPVDPVLNRIGQIKVHTYNYKHTGEAEKMNLPAGTQFGFIAQELEEIFPELVKDEVNVYNKNGDNVEAEPDMVEIHYKGVNQIGMIPILTAAIQEQQAEIEAQNALINDLRQRLEALENR